MKILIYFFVVILSFTSLYSSKPIIIDHTCIQKFESIPEAVLPDLAKLRVMFRHASVGTTINNALDCLQGTRNNPAECKNYPPYKYDRRNFQCQARGNSGWYGKVDDFVTEVQNQLNDFDIFSFKYCYLDGLDGLQEPCDKDFKSVQKAWNYLRDKMEFLEKKYPNKIFVWWSIPLTQVGQLCTDTLNNMIRNYVKQNNKILFDIADMQCYDENGNYQVNSNGWEIAYKPFCGEQQPGAQACHPNWTGSIRIAKAFWWMVYQLSNIELEVDGQRLDETDVSIIFQSDNSLRFQFNPSNMPITDIMIYNLLGNIILNYSGNELQKSNNEIHFDALNLPDGVYLLKISSQNKSILKKFVFFK
ncbi:MAG: T9SS type A sorting domain-containing protein [Candidatus Kapabacteria bacterium]|nr:T9SS type A sorting domain-containing protein [Candidatus Kapabacteria bacterium]